MTTPLVGIVMGSSSDWEIMQNAVTQLDSLGIPNEAKVLSAHRTPDAALQYAADAKGRGKVGEHGNPFWKSPVSCRPLRAGAS